jgi:hypothetical protein
MKVRSIFKNLHKGYAILNVHKGKGIFFLDNPLK